MELAGRKTLILTLVWTALGLYGCAKVKPRDPPQIPDPVGQKNKMLCSDGTTLVWCGFVGGASESITIDYNYNPFEIDINNVGVAKYTSSAITQMKEPKAGQLVVYGPEGSNEQNITALASSVPLVKIENGIIQPVDTIIIDVYEYFPTAAFTQGGASLAANWGLPASSYAVLGSQTVEGMRYGYLTFSDGQNQNAFLSLKLNENWDSAVQVKIELYGWTGGNVKANAAFSLDYSCNSGNSSIVPSWIFFGKINIYLAGPHTMNFGSFTGKLPCKINDIVKFKVIRLGTDETDNLTSNFFLESAVVSSGRKLSISSSIIQ